MLSLSLQCEKNKKRLSQCEKNKNEQKDVVFPLFNDLKIEPEIPMILMSFNRTVVMPWMPPYCFMQSSNDSQNPIKYMDTAIELAKKNRRPMAPPNSGPEK